jgi:Ca2+/Na+ antiporter
MISSRKNKKAKTLNILICLGFFVTLTGLRMMQSFKINYTFIIAKILINLMFTVIYEN